MESIQLSVTGMKCGGCVSTVEKILNNSDGIENVSVNLLTESAYFEITAVAATTPAATWQRGAASPGVARRRPGRRWRACSRAPRCRVPLTS